MPQFDQNPQNYPGQNTLVELLRSVRETAETIRHLSEEHQQSAHAVNAALSTLKGISETVASLSQVVMGPVGESLMTRLKLVEQAVAELQRDMDTIGETAARADELKVLVDRIIKLESESQEHTLFVHRSGGVWTAVAWVGAVIGWLITTILAALALRK